MKYLKIIFIYIIVFQTINDNLIVNLFGLNILKVTLFLFILLNVNSFRDFKFFGYEKKYATLFFLAAGTSLLINWDLFDDIQIPVFTLIAVIVYYIIFSSERQVKHILIAIIISLIVSSLHCILREDTVAEYTFRKSGGTGDPNEFSTTLLIGIGVLWGFYLDTKKYLISVLLLILLFVIGLLFAGSKSALLVFGIMVIIGMINLYKLSKSLNKLRNLGFLLIILVGAFIFIKTYFGDVLYLFIERFETHSTALERFKSWTGGYKIFRENLLFGIGPKNYSQMISIEFMAAIDEASREAHNIFIKTAVETGFLGLIPFSILIIGKIGDILKSKPNYTLSLMLIPPLFMGLTLSLTFEKYFWLALAMVANPTLRNYFNEK